MLGVIVNVMVELGLCDVWFGCGCVVVVECVGGGWGGVCVGWCVCGW